MNLLLKFQNIAAVESRCIWFGLVASVVSLSYPTLLFGETEGSRTPFETITIQDGKGTASTIEFLNSDSKIVVIGTLKPSIEVIDLEKKKPVIGYLSTVSQEYKPYEWALVSATEMKVFVPISSEKLETRKEKGQSNQVVSKMGKIEVWDLSSNVEPRELAVTNGNGLGVPLAKLSPDGRIFACQEEPSYSTGTKRSPPNLLVWDTKSGNKKIIWQNAHAHGFSSDGKYVVINDDNNDDASQRGIKVIETWTGKVIATKQSTKWESSFTLGPISHRQNLLPASVHPVTDTKWTVDLLEIPSLKTRFEGVAAGRTTGPAESVLYCVAFSSDGDCLVFANSQQELFFWRPATKKLVGPTKARNYVLGSSLAISADGEWIAYPWYDDEGEAPKAGVSVLSTTDEKKHFIGNLPNGAYGDVAFSPSAKILAVGDVGCVHLFRVE